MSVNRIVYMEPAVVVYGEAVSQCLVLAEHRGIISIHPLCSGGVPNLYLIERMFKSYTNDISRISCRVECSDRNVSIVGILGNWAVKICRVLSDAPLPRARGEGHIGKQGLYVVVEDLGKDGVRCVDASVHTGVVVLSYGLLGGAGHCVVVLQDAHVVHSLGGGSLDVLQS